MPARGKRQPSGPAAPGVTSGWRKNWRRASRDHKRNMKHSKGVGQNSGKPASISYEQGIKAGDKPSNDIYARRVRGQLPKSHKTAGWS